MNMQKKLLIEPAELEATGDMGSAVCGETGCDAHSICDDVHADLCTRKHLHMPIHACTFFPPLSTGPRHLNVCCDNQRPHRAKVHAMPVDANKQTNVNEHIYQWIYQWIYPFVFRYWSVYIFTDTSMAIQIDTAMHLCMGAL